MHKYINIHSFVIMGALLTIFLGMYILTKEVQSARESGSHSYSKYVILVLCFSISIFAFYSSLLNLI